MTEYLTLDDAFAVIDEMGFMVSDVGLLASAIARPRTTVGGEDAYPDLATKTAALMHSIARNHALLDGNKRTAWVLARLMLAVNGAELYGDEVEAEAFMLDVAQGFLQLEDMAKWIGDRVR
jgi:death on curing protein